MKCLQWRHIGFLTHLYARCCCPLMCVWSITAVKYLLMWCWKTVLGYILRMKICERTWLKHGLFLNLTDSRIMFHLMFHRWQSCLLMFKYHIFPILILLISMSIDISYVSVTFIKRQSRAWLTYATVVIQLSYSQVIYVWSQILRQGLK